MIEFALCAGIIISVMQGILVFGTSMTEYLRLLDVTRLTARALVSRDTGSGEDLYRYAYCTARRQMESANLDPNRYSISIGPPSMENGSLYPGLKISIKPAGKLLHIAGFQWYGWTASSVFRTELGYLCDDEDGCRWRVRLPTPPTEEDWSC